MNAPKTLASLIFSLCIFTPAHARYYDAVEARFLEEDPIEFKGEDVNLYRYAYNNPINNIDSFGLKINVLPSDRFNYNNAKNYLIKDPMMKRVFDELENSSEEFNIFTNSNQRNSFQWKNRKINWDPNMSGTAVCGIRQSPALVLGHELVHAYNFKTNPIAFFMRKERIMLGSFYTNAEEEYVIKTFERSAALTLKEFIRINHLGRKTETKTIGATVK